MHTSIYIWLLIGYLVGSFPSGKIIGRLNKLDIQKVGSGNIGFANTLRNLGWIPAIEVLLLDISKAFFVITAANHSLFSNKITIIAISVILGNVFPIWLKFKGGKGVATSAGIVTALNPWLGLIGIILWFILVYQEKTGSISSLVSSFLILILSKLVDPQVTKLLFIMFIIIVITHRKNITSILKGKEEKIL